MRIHTVLATLAIAIAVTGCNSVPILNVDQAPAISASGKPLNREQVRGAIVRAGAALGWQMKDDGPNMIIGSIQLRNHTATVAIPYNANSYSIKYRASTGLDEKGGTIHKNYNGWVQNLTRGINAQLSAS
jgi:hypothetical protein